LPYLPIKIWISGYSGCTGPRHHLIETQVNKELLRREDPEDSEALVCRAKLNFGADIKYQKLDLKHFNNYYKMFSITLTQETAAVGLSHNILSTAICYKLPNY
jgi:hypothetical protein